MNTLFGKPRAAKCVNVVPSRNPCLVGRACRNGYLADESRETIENCAMEAAVAVEMLSGAYVQATLTWLDYSS